MNLKIKLHKIKHIKDAEFSMRLDKGLYAITGENANGLWKQVWHMLAHILCIKVFEPSESLAVEQYEDCNHLSFREFARLVPVLFTVSYLMFLLLG